MVRMLNVEIIGSGCGHRRKEGRQIGRFWYFVEWTEDVQQAKK